MGTISICMAALYTYKPYTQGVRNILHGYILPGQIRPPTSLPLHFVQVFTNERGESPENFRLRHSARSRGPAARHTSALAHSGNPWALPGSWNLAISRQSAVTVRYPVRILSPLHQYLDFWTRSTYPCHAPTQPPPYAISARVSSTFVGSIKQSANIVKNVCNRKGPIDESPTQKNRTKDGRMARNWSFRQVWCGRNRTTKRSISPTCF